MSSFVRFFGKLQHISFHQPVHEAEDFRLVKGRGNNAVRLDPGPVLLGDLPEDSRHEDNRDVLEFRVHLDAFAKLKAAFTAEGRSGNDQVRLEELDPQERLLRFVRKDQTVVRRFKDPLKRFLIGNLRAGDQNLFWHRPFSFLGPEKEPDMK